MATIQATEAPKSLGTHNSPDGRWRVEVVRYECVPFAEWTEKAYEMLLLIDLKNHVTVPVDNQLQNCGGLGAAGLAGLFWSPSGKYFYYTDAVSGAPEGCGFWVKPVKFLDPMSHSVGDVGLAVRSPDESKMAAWQETDQGTDLIIWDVDKGEVMRFPAEDPEANTGEIVWSPTGTEVVYIQRSWACTPPGHYVIAKVDLAQRIQRTLLKGEVPAIEHVTWNSQEQLDLTDASGTKWVFSLANNSLSPSH